MDTSPYLWRIYPNPKRFPKKRVHWWRLAVALTLVPGVVIVTPWVWDRLFCRPGLPVSEVWGQEGECVGLSAGPYAFDRPELTGVMTKIAEQNEDAKEGSCTPGTKPVTVGVLATLTSVEAGGRALHELEGIAAAQASANDADCIHPIRLRVAQMGAKEQAAVEVAELLAEEVSAVVGVGLSLPETANAIDVLAKHQIPMVGDVITAEGFDRNGSRQDGIAYDRCDRSHTYHDGVGRGYFHRVAYRNADQIEQLANYMKSATPNTFKFIVTPITTKDPYTCTALALVHDKFSSGSSRLPEIPFDPDDANSVNEAAERICAPGTTGPVSIFYAARASHLPRFLKKLADDFQARRCALDNLTVVSTSDAARMRAEDFDENREELRLEALDTQEFKNGTIRLIYTPLADPDVLPAGLGLPELKSSFSKLKFDSAHLNSGWAITGFDAMTTVADAVNRRPESQPVTSSQINFEIPSRPVSGASGKITFDNDGNRVGSVPSVVRLCPAEGRDEPRTVPVRPIETAC